jgi:hypothetical protein
MHNQQNTLYSSRLKFRKPLFLIFYETLTTEYSKVCDVRLVPREELIRGLVVGLAEEEPVRCMTSG